MMVEVAIGPKFYSGPPIRDGSDDVSQYNYIFIEKLEKNLC